MEGKSFGSIMKNRRQEKGLSQEDLAFIAGVTKAAISRYEKDLRTPKAIYFVRICNHLNLDAGEMLNVVCDGGNIKE